MKRLKTVFEKNCDKTGKMKFIQLERTDSAAIYLRQKEDGTAFGYETFQITVVPKGTVRFGEVIDEDTEKYPSPETNFGRNAWFHSTLEAANNNYKRLKERDVIIETESEDIEEVATADVNDVIGGVTNETGSVEVVAIERKRGRPSVARPELVYPTLPIFTMKDLLALNTAWNQPTLYLQLQKDIEAKKVEDKGNMPHEGKGKAPKGYSLVNS